MNALLRPVPGEPHDRMRRALAHCSFLPASPHKRFARSVAAMSLHAITERQWRHVMRLAWRYRRQMPFDLVPSRDAIQALDAAEMSRPVRREAPPMQTCAPVQLSLFDGGGAV